MDRRCPISCYGVGRDAHTFISFNLNHNIHVGMNLRHPRSLFTVYVH
jgi:hypothetical protein